jgi:hypothetical protein
MTFRNALNVAAAGAALTLAQHAYADGERLSCWDGSFGYNAASIEKVEDGYEVAVGGSQIGPLEIDTIFERITLYPWNGNEPRLYAKFRDCQLDVVTQAASCTADAGAANDAFLSLFIQRDVEDLDQRTRPIARALVKKLAFELSNAHGFKLSVTPGDSDLPAQTAQVAFREGGGEFCRGNAPGGFEVSFPQRLRDYLRAHP